MTLYKLVITDPANGDVLHESDPIYESRSEARRSDAYHEYYDCPVKRRIEEVVLS